MEKKQKKKREKLLFIALISIFFLACCTNPISVYSVIISSVDAEFVTANSTAAEAGSTVILTAHIENGKRIRFCTSDETITPAPIFTNGGTSNFVMPNKDLIIRAIVEEDLPDLGIMKFVEGGTFQMGNDFQEQARPVHSVTLSDYYIGVFEVTQGEWEALMGTTIYQQHDMARTDNYGSREMRGVGSSHPMYYISWYEATAYCNALSISENLTPCYTGGGDNVQCDFHANGYRLPTEAEWEYAAKGGAFSKDYIYSGNNNADYIGWYRNNSNYVTHSVGWKSPNELGLYDMSGNVAELCWDWGVIEYSSIPVIDPTGPVIGFNDYKEVRGGCWFNLSELNSTYRMQTWSSDRDFSNGFRLCRSAY